MSQRPIFVATHPRACSTAFERVFMTRRDTIQCIHEPFGDAFYYGPERLSDRFAHDEQARLDSGFSESTYKTVLDRIEQEAAENEDKRVFIKDIMHYLLPPGGKPASIAPSLKRIKRGVGTDPSTGTNGANGHLGETAEPGNPTVIPQAILSRFHFAFLIRDPHFSVPSYYRCTIPPLDKVTGFYTYDPLEAGYDELRRAFDYLRATQLIGPHVATRELDFHELVGDGKSKPQPVLPGLGPAHESGAEICVVDADEMLHHPAQIIEAFCRSVGLDYHPDMLTWDTEADHQRARGAFEKWHGFHNDAIESTGLMPKIPNPPKSEEKYDAEWREKYGPQAAALIREVVDRNMPDYLYLKQFAMKVPV